MPLTHTPHDVPVVIEALPEPPELNVLWEQQLGLFWCWAASAVMVLRYYEKPTHQCEVASLLLGKKCCGPPRPDEECDQQCKADQVAPLYEKCGMLATQQHRVDHTDWQAEITARRPVQVVQQIDAQNGHMVVVRWAGSVDGVPKVLLNNPLRRENTSIRFDGLNAVDAWTGIKVDDHAAHG